MKKYHEDADADEKLLKKFAATRKAPCAKTVKKKVAKHLSKDIKEQKKGISEDKSLKRSLAK